MDRSNYVNFTREWADSLEKAGKTERAEQVYKLADRLDEIMALLPEEAIPRSDPQKQMLEVKITDENVACIWPRGNYKPTLNFCPDMHGNYADDSHIFFELEGYYFILNYAPVEYPCQ
jgi:hypothetical protein